MTYPLKITMINADAGLLMSFGHHDLSVFIDKTQTEYHGSVAEPKYGYVKKIPAPRGSNAQTRYCIRNEAFQGCIPATYAWIK